MLRPAADALVEAEPGGKTGFSGKSGPSAPVGGSWRLGAELDDDYLRSPIPSGAS
ncbi:hypothetical protein [Amycolatopsis australiensis]|nr:hypothetical protein [Amycolatopsis australiensis]